MLPRQDSNEFFMEIARGNVNGMSALRMYGYNGDVDAGTEDLWKTVAAGDGAIATRTLFTTAKSLSISSSNAGDTTQYVTVIGLDINYNIITATKKLAGQTETALSSTLSFFRVLSASLDAACAGNVFIYDASDTASSGVPTTGAKVQAIIPIADLETKISAYTMPAGQKGWLYNTAWNSYNATTEKGVIIFLVVTTAAGVTTTTVLARYEDPASGQFQTCYSPIEIPEFADVKLQVTLEASGSNMVIEGWADIVLEDITTTPATVTVLTKSQFDAQLSPHTLASTKLYLVGLDEVPTVFPTAVDLNDTLAIITGTTAYNVAATVEVAFNIDIFRTGLLIQTTQKAIACVWRCVDSNGDVLYNSGLSPKIITLGGKTLKTVFTQA